MLNSSLSGFREALGARFYQICDCIKGLASPTTFRRIQAESRKLILLCQCRASVNPRASVGPKVALTVQIDSL